MKREAFIEQVEQRLWRLFRASKQGVKAPAPERHRLEGFIQAGVFLQLVSREEMAERMEAIHQRVFGLSIAEREQQADGRWQQDALDYSLYDAPAFERYASQTDEEKPS